LPGIKAEEVGKLAPHARNLEDFVYVLQEKADGRIGEVTSPYVYVRKTCLYTQDLPKF
jgi:hypothetical protein